MAGGYASAGNTHRTFTHTTSRPSALNESLGTPPPPEHSAIDHTHTHTHLPKLRMNTMRHHWEYWYSWPPVSQYLKHSYRKLRLKNSPAPPGAPSGKRGYQRSHKSKQKQRQGNLITRLTWAPSNEMDSTHPIARGLFENGPWSKIDSAWSAMDPTRPPTKVYPAFFLFNY